MVKVDEAKYDRIEGLVYSVVLDKISRVGVSMAELKTASRELVPELKEYNDYHVGRFVGLSVTNLMRSCTARIGCDNAGNILIFANK